MRTRFSSFAMLLLTGLAANAASHDVPLPCDAKAIRISRDASTAALLCPDNRGSIIALPSGKVLRTINLTHPAFDALLATDGAWLALIERDGNILAWPTRGTDAPKTWSVGALPGSYVFLPNGLLLIDRTLWDVATARRVHTFDADFDVLNGMAMSGTRVATAGADTTIRGYDSAGWKQLFVSREMLMEPFGIAFTPDGSKLVIGGADYRVTLLDANTGQVIKTFPPLKDYINDIVPLAEKNWVAAQLADGRTANPTYWLLLNLESGEMRDVCGKATLVRFTSGDARCFSLEGRSLKAASEPLPSD